MFLLRMVVVCVIDVEGQTHLGISIFMVLMTCLIETSRKADESSGQNKSLRSDDPCER
jgi:hypothetical protein